MKKLPQKIVKLLSKKKLKISFAESCTGGLLSSTITSVSGSSKIFVLGLVTYSNQSKNSVLKIPKKILRMYGAVSYETCLSMVRNLSKIGCKKLLLYPYAHLSSNLAKPSVAVSLLKEMESSSSELEVSHSPFGWTKSYKLQVKGHPLAESSKVVTKDSPSTKSDSELTSEALEGESKIRSIWKIMSPDGTLSNIGDFDFSKHPKLEILAKYEAAKQRHVDQPPPHVALMKKMGIADYETASDSGNMRFFPNGRLIKSLIERYVTDRVKEYGGYEVETPIMYDSEHPSMVSYFNRFPARQYNIDSDGKKLDRKSVV